ncbi:hypothetical protein J41TS4_22270 [Paenibacillus apis]|uniref:Uncharacterized protein n=2 Tax=Paenibacillus apis TaxID=1792174 RepID=A0A919Y0R3_9BACL|nr:hypothetical protein J41TS4_22270 [Paenibacillus apis]
MKWDQSKPKAFISSYEIKQEIEKGQMTLHLTFDNPSGECSTYADFLESIGEFLATRNSD